VTATDIQLLKASVDKIVELIFSDGTMELVRVIFVFDEESAPDLFYSRIGADGHVTGDFSASLAEIVSVSTVPAAS
jgi:hypothetical protein